MQVFLTKPCDKDEKTHILSMNLQERGGVIMSSSPMMNMMKGVAIGMTAGVCVGIVGKNMVDSNPKLKKKANKAFKTMESVLDTAQYMFR